MLTVPHCFTAPEGWQPSNCLAKVQPDSKWIDAVTHLSMFRGVNIPEARQAFELLVRKEDEPSHQAVLYAAVARCLNSQMRLKEGGELLGHCWKLLGQDASPDFRAFVMLEMARYLLLVGNRDAASLMLEHTDRIASAEYLRRLLAYYVLAVRAASGEDVRLPLQDSSRWFERHGQTATAMAHRRMVAQLHMAQGEVDQAEELIRSGIELCHEDHLRFCRALFLNDLALLLDHRGEAEQAIASLRTAISLAEYPYSRIDSLDLLGKCLQAAGRYEQAVKEFAEAQNTASEAGTMIILPSLRLRLGQCHEALGQTELARHFFAGAYRSTMELLDHGFPATPTRLEAIREYVRFSGSQGLPAIAEEEEGFEFAMGRSLKEIRTIFQSALIDVQVEARGSRREAVEHLGIAQRSISNVRQRHREAGGQNAPATVIQFIRNNQDLNWKEINQKFDETLLAWLFERYDHNRKLMSEKLGLSYPHLSALITRAMKGRSGQSSERRTDVQ